MRKLSLKATTMTLLVAASLPLSAEDVIDPAAAKPAQSVLSIEVINVQSDVGSLYVSVYDSKETFLTDVWFKHKTLRVADHLSDERIVFELTLPLGEYAIAIHHDDNDNNKMDTNFIGIPKEPVAMSNNHLPRMGPPKYQKAKFLLETPQLHMQFSL